eukprot:130843-Hanusia_phi.AAC.1
MLPYWARIPTHHHAAMPMAAILTVAGPAAGAAAPHCLRRPRRSLHPAAAGTHHARTIPSAIAAQR